MPPMKGQWRQLRDFPAGADVAIGPYGEMGEFALR